MCLGELRGLRWGDRVWDKICSVNTDRKIVVDTMDTWIAGYGEGDSTDRENTNIKTQYRDMPHSTLHGEKGKQRI